MSELIIVLGGAASGKSAIAEEICCGYAGRHVYVATMRPFGEGAKERVARHRLQRAGKGFDTVECYTSLQELDFAGRCDVALLEDTGNLVANHLYGEAKADPGEGVLSITQQAGVLVVVANDVFREVPPAGTEDYVRTLAALHRNLVGAATTVVEAVCGLPHILYRKGSAAGCVSPAESMTLL